MTFQTFKTTTRRKKPIYHLINFELYELVCMHGTFHYVNMGTYANLCEDNIVAVFNLHDWLLVCTIILTMLFTIAEHPYIKIKKSTAS